MIWKCAGTGRVMVFGIQSSTLANELDAAYWVGAFGNYSFHDRVEFSLFTGIRRGGTACTAGTCYLVLPFEGAEFRITTHL